MERLKAIEKALRSIQFNVKHKDYARTIAHRDFYLQVITGENIDSLLPQFERRESPDLWKQRKAITIENLSPAISPVLNKYYKVARLPVREEIIVPDNEAATERLKSIEKSFYQDSDVKTYITKVLDDYGLVDPNAFLALGYRPFDGTGANKDMPTFPEPYPIIFDCEEVWDFVYTNKGLLDYLLTNIKSTIFSPTQNDLQPASAEVNDFYAFIEGSSFQCMEYHEYRKEELEKRQNKIDDRTFSNGKRYYVFESNNGSKRVKNQVQAQRLGYLPDKNAPAIRVSPIHKAKSHLRDIIRHKSGYDLSMMLHIFPKLFQYGTRCPGEPHISEQRKCVNGVIVGTNDSCTTCGGPKKGGGFLPQQSAQDVILVAPPKSGKIDEYVPLRDLAYYLTPPIEVVDKLKNEITDLQAQIFKAVFSTDLTAQTSGPSTGGIVAGTTATFTDVKKEDINDALLLWANNRSRQYRFIIHQTAIFNDYEVETVFEYSKKLEPETLNELLGKLSAYTAANVSEVLTDEIESGIAKQQFENDPAALKRYEVKRKFLPFRGKDVATKAALLESNLVPRLVKTLFANFAWVFSLIEGQPGGQEFYDEADFGKQWETVKAEVQKMVDESKADEPEPVVPTLPRKQITAA